MSGEGNRVCLITDALSEHLDDGMSRFAHHLAIALAEHFPFRALAGGPRPPDEPWLVPCSLGRTLLNPSLVRQLTTWGPRHCVYLPRAPLTNGTLARAWILRQMLPAAHLHVIGLQPRARSQVGRLFGRMSRARFYIQSRASVAALEWERLPAVLLPSGVDTQRFRPATVDEKQALRQRYKIGEKDFVVCHVGPLRTSRNPAWLEALSREEGVRLLWVGSVTNAPDEDTMTRLQAGRATVWTHHVPGIEDVYRLSDAYLFPVQDPCGAVEWPLSVLEASACGLPVMASRFGGLADVSEEESGIVFVDDVSDLRSALSRIRSTPGLSARARRWAETRTWANALRPLIEVLER